MPPVEDSEVLMAKPEPWSDEWIIAKFGHLFSGLGVYHGPDAFDERMYPAIRAIAAKAFEEAASQAVLIRGTQREAVSEFRRVIRARAREVADGKARPHLRDRAPSTARGGTITGRKSVGP